MGTTRIPYIVKFYDDVSHAAIISKSKIMYVISA